MRKRGYEGFREFDDYPIPEYDPTLTEEERKIKFAEAMENLNRVLRETKGISIKDIPSQK